MESTPGEVSNYILHDAECELYQKLLAEDFLPGTRLIGNISVTKYGTKMKKILFRTYIITRINWYICVRAILNFNFCYF